MVPAAKGVEQGFAGELARQQAGQPALRAEQGGARMAGTMAALVAVEAGQHAHPLACLFHAPPTVQAGAA
jgi:hypothetical protein